MGGPISQTSKMTAGDLLYNLGFYIFLKEKLL